MHKALPSSTSFVSFGVLFGAMTFKSVSEKLHELCRIQVQERMTHSVFWRQNELRVRVDGGWGRFYGQRGLR